jgi:hypothetical protein
VDFVELGEADVRSNELDLGGVVRDSHALDLSVLTGGEEFRVRLTLGLEGELEVAEGEVGELLEGVEAG